MYDEAINLEDICGFNRLFDSPSFEVVVVERQGFSICPRSPRLELVSLTATQALQFDANILEEGDDRHSQVYTNDMS